MSTTYSDEKVLDIAELIGDGRPRCECPHGPDGDTVPCGRRAKWRASVDCVCGEGHPRWVEILCSRCLATLRIDYGRESVTARRL